MGDIKDINEAAATDRVKDMTEAIDFCMFCTMDGQELQARPMSKQKVDEEGNIWFLSDKDSNKNKEIQSNPAVHLMYGKGHEMFLSLKGDAEILFDKAIIKDLWNPHIKVWFTEGVDDPGISIIKVKYTSGHYWDSKNGRMVQLAKMAASLLTGKTMDDGIEGDLQNR